MLMMRTINIANIGLTAPMEAINKGEDETTIYIKAVEEVYTKEINNIKEIREQNSRKKNTISIIN